MIYQLPTGKCVLMSLEQYFYLTDEDIEYMICTKEGMYLNSPSSYSVIVNESIIDNDYNDDDGLDIFDIYKEDEIIIDRSINIDDLFEEQDL